MMTKLSFKKSVMPSFQWRHRYFVTEKRHKIFLFWGSPIKITGYASGWK